MHFLPPLKRCMWLMAFACLQSNSQDPPSPPPPRVELNLAQTVTLHYGVEWRMIRAGTARLTWSPRGESFQGDLHIESAGLVSKLYRVKDDYRVEMTKELCATSVVIDAQEGKRHRETKITFGAGKANYLEKDLLKDNVVLAKELETPSCVHEYIGALNKVRGMKVDPGQSVEVLMSDGKRFANVRIEAQEREKIKTPTGTHNTIRYEVHMFNNVLSTRKARMYAWLTDDSRRMPVQLRVRMQFLIGTITLQLEKEERSQ
jgi:hypothetical protein